MTDKSIDTGEWRSLPDAEEILMDFIGDPFFLAFRRRAQHNVTISESGQKLKEARMEHKAKPLVGTRGLISLGALSIMGFTLHGIMNNPGELIRNDLLFGPIIAVVRIIVPLFLTLGVIHVLANVTKCEACGKILFWKKRPDRF
ncbi:MAG: hypothetical protein HQM00_10005 [Magnetococcales bacterium]|nr:hypothetical protein [Magnetococcales bacterium]